MEILKFFTNEHDIAGLEISDLFLKVVKLELDSTNKPRLQAVFHENLNPGDIVGGEIKNRSGFLATVNKLVGRSGIKFAIVSIPSCNVYSKIFNFPLGLINNRLEESIKLITDFQLPKKPEEVYIGWEKIINPAANDVLISSINKELVKDLISALDEVGVKTVAVEFHPLSLARLLNPEETWLIIEKDTTQTSLYVLKNKIVQVLTNIPIEQEISLEIEVEKITNFYEFSNAPINKLAIIGEFKKSELGKIKLTPEIIHLPKYIQSQDKLEENNNWLIAFGTALRGLKPRKEDGLTSLMEVGTEENYNQQTFFVFIKFLSKVTITLSIFFSLVFAGCYLFMQTLQNNFNQKIEYFNASTNSIGSITLEEKAENFNNLINATDQLVSTEPQWSLVINELKLKITPGIIISNLSMPAIDQPMTIVGIAENRTNLNLFKKSLGESSLFQEIALPLENLGMKEKIPFSVSFSLKNPDNLYIK